MWELELGVVDDTEFATGRGGRAVEPRNGFGKGPELLTGGKESALLVLEDAWAGKAALVVEVV